MRALATTEDDYARNPYCVIVPQTRAGGLWVELPSRYCKGDEIQCVALAADGYSCAICVVDVPNGTLNRLLGVREAEELQVGQFRIIFDGAPLNHD